jgi:heparan-alpha-glucosaminide N-acetyltransferase
MPPLETPAPVSAPQRLVSLDAYRGFVMLLMLAEVLRLGAVAKEFPESEAWQFAAWHQTHVEWVGCTLHDLIQPSFSFIVGVAVPFSIASRRNRGQAGAIMLLHALWRSVLLVFLGVFLRSKNSPTTNWVFEDTLSQIGLGYFFLFVIGMASRWVHWLAFAGILVGYWAAFATYEVPADLVSPLRGVSQEWQDKHGLEGFSRHWSKNANLAHDFDNWFLNQFPREKAFRFNGGGYQTLSFIPTLATMILGLIAGTFLQGHPPTLRRALMFAVAGGIGLAVGWALGYFDIVPVVKRIWTPSWVLYSGGWCLLLLALFYLCIDVTGFKAWAFPLVVIGMNSIVAYCLAGLTKQFFNDALKRHLGASAFRTFGTAYEPLLLGGSILLIWWLILFWMYRNRVFLRI